MIGEWPGHRGRVAMGRVADRFRLSAVNRLRVRRRHDRPLEVWGARYSPAWRRVNQRNYVPTSRGD